MSWLVAGIVIPILFGHASVARPPGRTEATAEGRQLGHWSPVKGISCGMRSADAAPVRFGVGELCDPGDSERGSNASEAAPLCRPLTAKALGHVTKRRQVIGLR